MSTTIAVVSYTAVAEFVYERLVEANDVRVLRTRRDRLRGHAVMATWAVCWPAAGVLCVGAAIVDEAVRGVAGR